MRDPTTIAREQRMIAEGMGLTTIVLAIVTAGLGVVATVGLIAWWVFG